MHDLIGHLRVLLAWCMVWATTGAMALDVPATEPPQPISDSTLVVGDRSVQLPPGSWVLIAKQQDYRSDGNRMNKHAFPPTYTAYAMNSEGKAVRAGVVLRLGLSSYRTASWNEEPCAVKDYLYRDDFDGSFSLPECLLVFKRRSHLTASTTPFYAQAQSWLREQGIPSPGATYELQYFRFGQNDYGWVRIFLPQNQVISEAAVLEYARQLPAALKTLFERRSVSATLPAPPLVNVKP